MTVIVTVQTNNGIVMAADSAQVVLANSPNQRAYDNHVNTFNLCKGYPLGIAVWQAVAIGPDPIGNIVKAYRRLFKDQFGEHPYTVEEVASNFAEYLTSKYKTAYQNVPMDDRVPIQCLIVGYSTDANFPEQFQISLDETGSLIPSRVTNQQDIGLTWRGEGEAITRLVAGFSENFHGVLIDGLGVQKDVADEILKVSVLRLGARAVPLFMPIQDAVELAKFLVDTATGFARFMTPIPSVSGPVEIAAITKYEGFKWITRKHYYDKALNMENH